jgi:opacity protein-like surface antigen
MPYTRATRNISQETAECVYLRPQWSALTHALHPRTSPRSSLLAFLSLLAVLALPKSTSAQMLNNLELGGGYVHMTSDFGTDGFNASAAWRFSGKVAIGADYDSAWDNSRIGTFELTQVGALTSKTHLQNFLFGPRIFFSTARVRKYKFIPFAEAQFGVSHLNSQIQSVTAPSVSTSDTAFSWMLGGGSDYRFSPHWAGRLKLDFLRTHFAEAGQSRLRVALGVAYTFGGREQAH